MKDCTRQRVLLFALWVITGMLGGCVGESFNEGDVTVPEMQVAEAEVAASPDAVSPNAIGEFHLIRMVNTQLCLQPAGGSTGDVPIELAPCTLSAGEQNWLFISQSQGQEIVNQKSGKCIYYDSDELVDGWSITHASCNIFGTNSPASNALWKPSGTTGLATLMSRLHHRDTGFCLDVPDGNPFPGTTMQIWHCNGTPAQAWIVGVE